MTLAYVAKLGLIIFKTDVGIQKINGSTLMTYEIVIVGFTIQDKLRKVPFFEETFLSANTSMEVVVGMLFLFSLMQIYGLQRKSLNRRDIQLQRLYLLPKVLSSSIKENLRLRP